MEKAKLFINGEPNSVANTFAVVNPASAEIFAEAPACDESHVNRAIEGAAAAFYAWRKDITQRRNVLNKMAELIRDNSEVIALLLTQEQGKPLKQARSEVMTSVMQIQWAASTEIPQEVLQDNHQGLIKLIRKPYGVVVAIVPWNYPVSIAMGKVATALIAGNTVVLKPSPYTPMATLKIAEVTRGIFPAGVFNTLSGSDSLGAQLTQHALVRKIDFTGSVNTGKKVAAVAASDLKRVTLELGGNDPAIILPDANPKKIAKALFWGAFSNSGQVCVAIKRVYVHESIHESLLQELAALANVTPVGNGLDDNTRLGPINNRAQFERVSSLVSAAKQQGARVVAGGSALNQGYCFQPTILSDLRDDEAVVTQEQFGPVLPVLSYCDLDDAINRANASHFGLGSSVWSDNAEQATVIAEQLEAGTTWVNQHLVLSPIAPFGGSKCSGLGAINGKWGLEGATQMQVINVAGD